MAFAKKSLGQNFLISPGIVERIAQAGDIQKGETVIEIGPGKGVLTAALLRAGAKVKAIEKDDRLISLLDDTFRAEAGRGDFELFHDDVMEMTPEKLSARIPETYKVIANIPYYITGQIIRLFLSMPHKPSIMVLMVQKEVANRIIARDEKESILSLSVKAYAKPELVVSVARGNFFPIPNVDSAVIKLSEIRNPFADRAEEDRFFEIVKAGFAQKRKKLIRNLEAVTGADELARAFATLQIGENARAENIALDAWVRLAKELRN
jgi:16S rRNA (adenine1518-N6/adenine1519-N6)-dimethyltransferase